MARQDKAEQDGSGSYSRVRRRQTDGSDAKVKRSIARAQAIVAGSSSSTRDARFGRRRSASTRDSSRLRFLLAVLLATTLSLVVLQAVRHFALPSSPHRREAIHRRTLLSRLERSSFGRALSSVMSTSNDADERIAYDSMPSGAAIAAQRSQRHDEEQNPLDWRNYIAAMRKHFHDELSGRDAASVDKKEQATSSLSSSSSSSAGMAVVPGEEVRDHVIAHTADEDEPVHVAGKTKEEAREDRAIALDELDQETLKAMFDAVYGRRQ